MKPIALLLFPLLSFAAVAPTDISTALDLARSAPGEFAADALIRIASVDRLDKAKRIELLNEAFRRAPEAQQAYRLESVMRQPTGPSGFLNRANRQELDALSLRLRAVEAMLPLDSRKAKELFLEIPHLNLPKIPCQQFMVYNVTRFYDVLGRVARQSFTAREVARREPVRFLESYMSDLSSAAQVAPVAHLLQNFGGKDADLENLVTQFAGAIGKISGDDRSFTHYATADGPVILALADELKKRKLSPGPLVDGYRLYLVNNLTGQRCADDDLMGSASEAYSLSGGRAPAAIGGTAAEFFNNRIAVPPAQPLSENEMTPSKMEGAAAGVHSCRDSACQEVTKQLHSLVFAANGNPLTYKERSTTGWQTQLQQFLNSLANWTPGSDIEELQYFREKCGLYQTLMGAVSDAESRQKVVLAWLDFLIQSRTQVESRLEWFLPVNELIGRIRLDSVGMGQVADRLRQANDPVIALYSELERIAPRSPESIMAVM
jgi:hypothetical protein